MLSFQDSPTKLCDGTTRREILRVGGLSLLGLTLPELLHAREALSSPLQTAGTFGRAKNVIFLYLAGGPPQHETFDPKPEASADIRGEFQPISTVVPGIQFCELLPRTARVANHLAVVRSLSTNDSIHSSSGAWVLTGHKYNGNNARTIQPTDWPYIGSIVKMLKPSEALPSMSTVWIPDWCRLNENVKPSGQTGGMLGRLWDPERFIGDPSQNGYRVDGLQSSDESLARLQARRGLLTRLENRVPTGGHDYANFQKASEQAFDVLTSGKAAEAFRIEKESRQTRERYGLNRWGQCVLLARRLVEAGVRMVHVQWPRMPGDNAVDNPLWDTHAQNFDRLEDVLCPIFDVGFSALIEDLNQRGLLDETLVVAVGEFGRTPKINAKAGRDHWGNVFSCALAGAGISGGQVFGKSDMQGGLPIEDRVEPGDLTASIYHLLGIDHKRVVFASDGRAIPITRGEPIQKLLGIEPAIPKKDLVAAGGDPKLVPPYQERLLSYNDWPEGVVIRDFEGPSRPKTWRASTLPSDATHGLGSRLVGARSNSGAVPDPPAPQELWLGIFGQKRDATVEPGAQVLLSQEVRSPFAGTFVLSMTATGIASSASAYQRLQNCFRCRLMLIQFANKVKNPSEHSVLAEVTVTADLSVDNFAKPQVFQVKKTFAPANPGQNISFGAGLAVAVSLEQTSGRPATIPSSGEDVFAALRIGRISLEFEGKQINEDVKA